MIIKIRVGAFDMYRRIAFAIRQRFPKSRRSDVAEFEHCCEFIGGAAIKIEGVSTRQLSFARSILLFFKRKFSEAHRRLKAELQARLRRQHGRRVKLSHTVLHTLSSFPLRVRA